MSNQIAKYIKLRGLTQEQVAKELNVSRQAVQQWTSGKSPTLKNLKALAKLLNTNVSALSAEEGEDDGRDFKLADLNQPAGDYIRIPVFDADASCGSGAEPGSEAIVEAVDFRPSFIHSLPGVVGTSGLHIVHANGDSMEPTIENRSFCIVDSSQSVIRGEGIFCLMAENQIFIKRVQRNIDGSITLISDNPAYSPQRVDKATLQNVKIIGKIVYVFNGKNV